jgi:hypothetical protein
VTIATHIKKAIKEDDQITLEFRKLIEDILILQDNADDDEEKNNEKANISVQIKRYLENICQNEKFVEECKEYESKN